MAGLVFLLPEAAPGNAVLEREVPEGLSPAPREVDSLSEAMHCPGI